PEPAPSKNAVLRSRLPPAPGGISWPSRPAGWGSNSGADITPDQGFAIKSMSAMVKPRPRRPNIAANPTTYAVIEAVIRATVPTFAHQFPLRAPNQLCTIATVMRPASIAEANTPSACSHPVDARKSTRTPAIADTITNGSIATPSVAPRGPAPLLTTSVTVTDRKSTCLNSSH